MKTMMVRPYAPQFSSVLAMDIGGRGGTRAQLFHEAPAFQPTDTSKASAISSIEVGGKTLEEILTLWSEQVAALVKANLAHFNKDPLRLAGIAFPGSIQNNKVLLADNLSTNTKAKWENIDLATLLKAALQKTFQAQGIRETLADSLQITLANDLVAGILGERHFGKAAQLKEGVIQMAMIGTGYGGSKLIASALGDVIIPGEPGQVVSNPDNGSTTIEEKMGHAALREQAKTAGLGDIKPSKLIDLAFTDKRSAKKDERIAINKAKAILDNAADYLAKSLSYFVQGHNVQNKQIIVGGGIPLGIEKTGGKGAFLAMLQKHLSKRCRPEELAQAKLAMATFDNNLVGASVLAQLNDPNSALFKNKPTIILK